MSTGSQTVPGAPSALSARRSRWTDVAFGALVRSAGFLVLAIILAIFVFLTYQAVPALRDNTANFLTETSWYPDATSPVFGIAALAFGTLLTSVLAMILGVPVAIGIAVFITEFAPKRLARWLGYLTDLLAAVPSVIFGLWALGWLLPHMGGLQDWLASYMSWIPLFAGAGASPQVFSKSILNASIVLAIMILPIVAAIAREVLERVDPGVKEAALALGATHWEMVRMAVLPPSRPGLVSATMLGLGRALGETIAIALVIGSTFDISLHILPAGGNSIAANIATKFSESGDLGVKALIASGLVLFIITLAVNLAARAMIRRGPKGAR